MEISSYTILTWRKAAAALIPATFVCAVFATFVLDALMLRPTVDGGSVNTLLPGATYAMATIMKVCLLEGLIMIVVAIISYLRFRKIPDNSEAAQRSIPFWTIGSLLLPPLAIASGAIAIMAAQSFSDLPGDARSYTFFSRTGVLVMLACLAAAASLGAVALIKRESLAIVPVVSIAAVVALIVLFWYFEFYAIGFHQDNWAPHR